MATLVDPYPTTLEDYKALLSHVMTCFDNQLRTRLENSVARSLNDPNTAFILVQIINEPCDPAQCDPVQSAGIRQFAAVLLRKRVLTMWRGLEPEHRDELKSILLTQMGAEPVRLVRFAIAHVLCVIARVELRRGWPQLMQALHEASASPAPEHRELACVLVHSLSKSIVDETGDGGIAAANENLQLAGKVVLACLGDDVWAVRKSALKAVGALAPLLGGTRSTIKAALVNELVPRAAALISECGAAGSSASLRPSEMTRVAMEAVEVLENILVARPSKMETILDDIITTMIQTASAVDAHVRVREEATEVLVMHVNSRPKAVVKRNLVPALLQLGVALVSEDTTIAFEAPNPEDEDEEEGFGDDDDVSDGDDDAPRPPSVFGGRLLTALGECISTKRVLPSIMEVLGQQLQDGAESTARKGAIIAAASIAGGCAGAMRTMVDKLVRACDMCSADPSACVRAAAAHALLHFVTHLQPEILAYHTTVMPLLLRQLDDPDDLVRTRVTRTVEGLCDEMGPDLEPYVPELVSRLVAIIPASSETAQRYICGALAAIANGKSPSVKQYAAQIFNLLESATGPTASSLLRARAIEAVGVLATAVGTEIFTPQHFNYFWQQVQQAFSTDIAQLREMCFGFAANMATLLGEQFAPYASSIVDAALALLNDETGGGKVRNADPLARASDGFDFVDDEGRDYRIGRDNDSESDDDYAADLGEELEFVVRQADVEEKTAAIYCLGVLVASLGQPMAAHLAQVVDVLENCVMHAHTPIRINAIHALVDTVAARQAAGYFPQPVPLVVKGVMPQTEELCDDARTALDDLIRAELLPIMNTDDSSRVVAAACDAIVDIVQRFGAVGIHPYLEEILEVTGALLRQEAPCQADDDGGNDSEGEGDDEGSPTGFGGEDDDDHDSVLIDSVSEIVDTLCVAYGPSFAPHFQRLAVDLLPYTAPERPGEDHVFSVGVLATCLEALGPAFVAQYFRTAADIAFGLINVTSESVARSNCCFLIRVLIEYGGPANVTPDFVLQSLQLLSGVIGAEDEMPSTIDNAVSATCSIVRCYPTHLPLAVVLPELLSRLPMRIDADENHNACQCLAALSAEAASLLQLDPSQSLFGQLVAAVARTLSAPKVAADDKSALFMAVAQGVVQPHREAFVAAASELPEEVSQVLASLVQ